MAFKYLNNTFIEGMLIIGTRIKVFTTCCKLGILTKNDKYIFDINVGDGCWRPNMLVTSLRCW